jgi:hypothetical protein
VLDGRLRAAPLVQDLQAANQRDPDPGGEVAVVLVQPGKQTAELRFRAAVPVTHYQFEI